MSHTKFPPHAKLPSDKRRIQERIFFILTIVLAVKRRVDDRQEWECVDVYRLREDCRRCKNQSEPFSFIFVVLCCLLLFMSSSRTFFLQANLKRHTETHIKGIPWPCNICGKVSGSKSGLAQHKAKYHKDQESAMVVKVGLPILLLDSKLSFSATNGPEHPG